MRNSRLQAMRTLVVSLFALFFVAAPMLGWMYGTNCALTLGGFTMISPLELILLVLGTKSLFLTWMISGSIVVFIIVIYGRLFCGWICPTGMLLEYSHAITEARRKERTPLPSRKPERYAVLLAVLAASLLFEFAAPYLFSPPGAVYRTLVSFIWHGVLGADVVVLFSILVLDLLARRYGRTWCSALCPLGTVISSLSFLNLLRPKVDREACIGSKCLNCWRVCPMRIPVTDADRWMMMECSKCLRCWANCPARAITIGIR